MRIAVALVLLPILLPCVPACAEDPAARVTRFRVAPDNAGVWWITPSGGAPMLSLGVDCIGPGVETSEYDPARPQYTFATRPGDTYAAWEARTLKRMRAWGFNTAAGWCHDRFQRAGLVHTPVLHIGVSLGAPWIDPWDPAWGEQVARLAVQLVTPYKDDPAVLGYFLDNEFGWGDDWILGLALGWPAGSPGKRRLLDVLKETYRGDLREFRKDFLSNATTWEQVLTASATGRRAGRGHRAQDAFVEAVAAKYYDVCGGAVRKVDPGALVLGDRFRQYYPQAVARAARGRLDVISTNYEATTTDGWLSPAYFISMHEHSGLPVIIGEFYATARQNRSGNRNHGGEFTLVDTQAERGAVAASQSIQYARFPFMVGWHWFQWSDEPTHGRDDGEDYNMGLVDIYDEPYAELTGALRAANEAAPRAHAAGPAWLRTVRGEGFRGPFGVAPQSGLVADGKLGDWDKARPVPRIAIRTDAPQRPFGDVFLAWDEGALRLAIRAYDFSVPAGNEPSAKHPATWGDLHRLKVRIDDWSMSAATGLVAAPKAAEDQAKTVRWVEPPKRGQVMPAVWTHVDRWHYVWEIAIPAAAIASGGLRAGRRFMLSLDIENRGDFERMRIDRLPVELLARTPFEAGRREDDWIPRHHELQPPPPDRREAVFAPDDPPRSADPGWDDVPWPPRPRPGPGPGISAPPEAGAPVVAPPHRPDAPTVSAPATPGDTPVRRPRRPRDRRLPEKPATPETSAQVPETKDVPGKPPADRRDRGERPESPDHPDRPDRPDRAGPAKPSTPETTAPVPETKEVPGRPPAGRPGGAEPGN